MMRVSVVICTLNRAQGLIDTLQCLRHQNYQDFEVVVVNGPSTDGTEQALLPWMDSIRFDRCPLPNLSLSRNIGIRAAAGDVIAFIDDDALPEFDWLIQALPSFQNDEVAGVGGIVFDHTGMSLQYKYSAANRFAETEARHDRPYDDQCQPGSFQFPYLQGTNALFRRSALAQIGGFDETFDYYLDETDVCCRLIDAGYALKQLNTAPVHHKFLPSSVRDHQRVITNWRPIVKNQVYFSYRHALDPYTEQDIHEHSLAFIKTRVDDALYHELAGRLPPGASKRAAITCAEAFRVGMTLGYERRHIRLGPAQWDQPKFKQFATLDLSRRRKITFIGSGYSPNMTGGIARFFSDLAPALAARGHEVRVITKALGPAAVDLENGVWVHRISTPAAGESGVAPDVFNHINDFSSAAVHELERIGSWSTHDVVYGPMWDVEVLGALTRTPLPIAVQVATPLAIAADMAGHGQDPILARLMQLETKILQEADLFHANSMAVATTISDHYGEEFTDARWQVVHLGLVDNQINAKPVDLGSDLIVFFVGRFEKRKGIDTLLDAIERLAPCHPHVRFVLAGEDRPLAPGQQPVGSSWAARHADAKWIEQVSFPGSVTDEELHELYSSADLVVLPSRYESFGLVMVEAMVHGKALISCDTSGIRDVVQPDVDGVLVEPGNVDALVQSIEELLSDHDRRGKLGAAARSRFVEVFHIDRFAERFDRFIQRVRILDASKSSVISAPSGATSHRSAVGTYAITLSAGDHFGYTFSEKGQRRMVVQAVTPSEIVINDGRPRHETVMPGEFARYHIDPEALSADLKVMSGCLQLHGVVEVLKSELS